MINCCGCLRHVGLVFQITELRSSALYVYGRSTALSLPGSLCLEASRSFVADSDSDSDSKEFLAFFLSSNRTSAS